ncbi:DNA mismatch repair protein MutS [candidate division WWE3 bacterium CG_4_9_14_0_2_um_filter_35_11]|uniref:DNA mismatch repair protein MutS n=1 Tax=candidate division WWE3 bacterium CG_4_9_14_0_2_um_filter_35_11 TaxID=1975077 RepID=A0A2M8EMB8_UNCKA|nr:MAG: DNA mismatch repair protein MutS [candidate division WWE3 bacterium CG10_big_fil_rev_8_21_14_0_10_35_32]PJC23870.1 MAG: DNA mismatch repair protein MutS [candidate division WWE3 bacterium CG_4_9_14_0_2_um_filter_35_11]
MKHFETPMMKQYASIKSQYTDCILLFRLGDFYEMFLEDAEIGSKVLDITLTARNKGKDGAIPMCGVPFHASDAYISKLVKNGHKVAICEQIGTPQESGEIVERDVIRVVTPGTIVDENMLENKSNNYVLSLSIDKKKNLLALAYADISTGDFIIKESQLKPQTIDQNTFLTSKIIDIDPSEILLKDDLYNDSDLLKKLKNSTKTNISKAIESNSNHVENLSYIKDFFKVKSLEVFSIDENDLAIIDAIKQLLEYLMYTQKDKLFHIKKIKNESNSEYMQLDFGTINNLEIFYSNKRRETSTNTFSLIETLDKTYTAMGGRLLKSWISSPLFNLEKIQRRLDIVEHISENHRLREKIQENLKHIADIERLVSKVGTNTANARDLIGLSNSLQLTSNLLEIIIDDKVLNENLYRNLISDIKDVSDLIKNKIRDEPPVSIHVGGMIKENVDQGLDDIKESIKDSKDWISQLELIEKKATGISTLKVGFNSVFGYYIEVSKANSTHVPVHYIRKQTLVNSERYITDDLKFREDIVLNAEEKINKIELEIFQALLIELLNFTSSIQKSARIIGNIDCLQCFAAVSIENNYVKPKIYSAPHFSLILNEARHPVIEKSIGMSEFTPNSTNFNKKEFIHLITGPNMSGKSTYIRQIALIQIMAQAGSFVPASVADISIVDGIFTRIGAGDAIAQGLSTFMVEMIETAKILNNATENSLIILDEVGRGTSTADGLSIAKAITEFIHNKIKAKTLFATHFHELTTLDQKLKSLKNYHIEAISEGSDIKFLHKVEKGGTDKSYGIEVAKLAGIPDEVIDRAKELLNQSSNPQLKLNLF